MPLGFTTSGAIFLRMWPFFNPTIEVVTFCLRGQCMLGVVLLLAFTRLGHECYDLLSLCAGMHECRLDLGLYSHLRVLGEWNQNPCNSMGKIPSEWFQLVYDFVAWQVNVHSWVWVYMLVFRQGRCSRLLDSGKSFCNIHTSSCLGGQDVLQCDVIRTLVLTIVYSFVRLGYGW